MVDPLLDDFAHKLNFLLQMMTMKRSMPGIDKMPHLEIEDHECHPYYWLC